MKLAAGDRVAVISPASQLRGADRGLLVEAVNLLESWGLRVDLRASPDHHFYLAGTDLERAKSFGDVVSDPDIRAVFCTRGGYGSPRLLKHLDRSVEPQQKLLIGYSDITALHLAVQRLWPQIRLVHGPNVATKQFLEPTTDGDITRESLRALLFSDTSVTTEPVEFLKPGTASGRLVGGCLSMVVSLLGTPYFPSFQDGILFLEDTGEAPFRVDRMITQICNAGILANVRGVVFGTMRNCTDPYNDIRAVLKDLLVDHEVPVAFGLRSGHGNVNLSLPLGVTAMLNSTLGEFRIGDVATPPDTHNIR